MEWKTHEEDVWFDFRGTDSHQLTQDRYYRGTVDGFADFGVFVNIGEHVTGLLHRSKLDKRLESLDWDPGDTVFVKVTEVHDNGNVDLGWSIRQSEREFRGARVDDPDADEPYPLEEEADEERAEEPTPRVRTPDPETDTGDADEDGPVPGDAPESGAEDDAAESSAADATDVETPGGDSEATSTADEAAGATDPASTDEAAEPERVAVDDLDDRVDETVRIEGEMVSVNQTSGPTVFELRDETGTVECAAFEEAGVRAYPGVEVGDLVRLDGVAELRRGELQVETDALSVLDGDERQTVSNRLDEALETRAEPEAVEPLAADGPITDAMEGVRTVAGTIRRAVFEGRPVIVRHSASVDGYVAGAAIERAVLPLVRAEHEPADAVYHYFDRHPLEDSVYDMDDATRDVTSMLEDRERHDEKFPLFVVAAAGSTRESLDGFDLLDVYDAKRVVVDAAPADEEVRESVDAVLTPAARAASDGGWTTAPAPTTSAFAANVAAHVNPDVREDLGHLPAVSYWEALPDAYEELAAEAGYDEASVRELREAVALVAYYQSYEDKRELVTDILFGEGETTGRRDAAHGPGDLAGHVSEQFREKLDTELETAKENVERRKARGTTFAVIDLDAFTHRFDFPPSTLLLDQLHRREADEGSFVTVGVDEDALHLRSNEPLDLRGAAEQAREKAPETGLTAHGARDGQLEFLAGERETVVDAVLSTVAERLA